jgi:DNA-binding NtrC family response regulator
VIKIELPLLKDRREDIPLLIDHFIENYCSRLKKRKKSLDSKALPALINHDWPGNVRELQNVIERIVALHAGAVITEKDIQEHLTILRPDEECDFMDFSYEEAKEIFERKYLENLLNKFSKNLENASRFAKVHPATLYRKLKQHALSK